MVWNLKKGICLFFAGPESKDQMGTVIREELRLRNAIFISGAILFSTVLGFSRVSRADTKADHSVPGPWKITYFKAGDLGGDLGDKAILVKFRKDGTMTPLGQKEGTTCTWSYDDDELELTMVEKEPGEDPKKITYIVKWNSAREMTLTGVVTKWFITQKIVMKLEREDS